MSAGDDYEPPPGSFGIVAEDFIAAFRAELVQADAVLARFSGDEYRRMAEFVEALHRNLDSMLAVRAISMDAMVNGDTEEHTRRIQALTRQLHEGDQ